MKFFSNVLTLLAAASAYSYSIKIGSVSLSEDSIGLFKRDVTLNVSPECQKEMDSEEYLCLGTIDKLNIDTLETVCPVILSEKCKKVYENPLTYFPKCKDEEYFKATFTSKDALTMLKAMNELKCATDGEGNVCPGAKALLQTGMITEYTVAETCPSKKCYTALDNLLGSMVNNLDNAVDENAATKSGNIQVFAVLKQMLNASSCTSQTVDDTSSGATSNLAKLCSSILLAIAISVMYF